MKTFLLAFLCLTLPLSAATPRHAASVAPTPAAAEAAAEPLPESIPMARQRTVQEDLELRDWIVGIQTTAQDAEKRADDAEKEAKASRDQTAIAGVKLEGLQTSLDAVQKAFDAERTAKEAAQSEAAKQKAMADEEHKARVAADTHLSKIKTYLGFALGALLALVAEYVLAQITLPPPLSGYLFFIRIGAPIAAFGIGWMIVARFV